MITSINIVRKGTDSHSSNAMSNSTRTESSRQRRQGIYWLLTIPHSGFTPYPVPGTVWCRGQLELAESGFLHWQILVAFARKVSLRGVRATFGDYHAELTFSERAEDYVWKEDTRVSGTQFEFGRRPINRNSPNDWDEIWDAATRRDLNQIPTHIRVQSYAAIRRIGADYANASSMERSCFVFWGSTGTGKSRRAWAEAGMDAYPKDPRTKWWCGYRDHEHVVIDEFTGSVDICHLLRWLDRYPVLVEVKGGSLPLCARRIWLTSNIDPRQWYPEAHEEQVRSLMRRLQITHFDQL